MLLMSTRLCIIALHHLTEAYYEGYYVPIPDIAARYNINPRAIQPALKQLVNAGILKSQVGGKEPGYRFARDPQLVSLFDVLLQLEGNKENPCCVDLVRELNCDCIDKSKCALYTTLDAVLEGAKKQFSGISIAEMCR